jgi:hypothetical protein
LVLGLLDVLRLTEPRSAGAWQFTVAGARTFFTERTQFLQKTNWPQLAENMDVAEIVLRKSVGILYTKRTQFWGNPPSLRGYGAARGKRRKHSTFNIE